MIDEQTKRKRRNICLTLALIPWGLVAWGLIETFYWARGLGDGDLYRFISMIPAAICFFWFLAIDPISWLIQGYLYDEE